MVASALHRNYGNCICGYEAIEMKDNTTAVMAMAVVIIHLTFERVSRE